MANKQTILIEVNAKTDKVDKLKKSIKELREANKRLQRTQKELDRDFKKGLIDLDTYESATNDLTNSIDKNTDTIKENNQELKETNQELKRHERVANSATGSIEQLRAQSVLLNRELERMSENERENTSTGKAMQSQLSEINDAIAEFGIETKNGTDLFARYTVGIERAFPAMQGLSGGLQGLKEGFQNTGSGVKSGIRALKSFKVALAATGIGLILIAIQSLISYFQKTDKGAKALKVGMAALGAIMDTLSGVIVSIGETLFDAFTNPKQALIDLWEFIKGQYVNRFQALINIFKKLKDFDFDDLGDEFLTLATGVEDVSGKVTSLTDAIKENVKQAAELEKLRQQYKATNRILDLQSAKLKAQKDLKQLISDDDTQSFRKQIAASKEVLEFAEKESAVNKQIAANNLELINREIALKKANGLAIEELKDTQLEAQRAVMEADNEYVKTVAENAIQLRKIKRDEFEQDLDLSLDVYDNDKKNLERELKNEKLSAQEKLKILDEIKAGDIRNQKEIIDLYEGQTGKKIELDKLLAENNVATLTGMIKDNYDFNEIETNRLREVIIERQNYNQDLIELERELNEGIKNEDVKAAEEKKAFQDGLKENQEQTELEKLEADKIASENRAAELITDEQELANALLLIDEQYANDKKAIQEKTNQLTLAATKSVLQSTTELFKENTLAAKGAAIVSKGIALGEIAISSGKAIAAGIASAQSMPYPGNLIATATTIATVLANIVKAKQIVSGVKFNRGGKVFGGKYSDGDTIPAMLSPQEAVLTPTQQTRLGGDSAMAMAGVPGFALGGKVSGGSNYVTNNIVKDVESNTTIVTKEIPVLVLRDVDDIRTEQATEVSIETD